MKSILLKIIWLNEIGHTKIIGRVIGIIPQLLMVLTFLKVYGISASWQMAVLLGLIWYSMGILCGWLYIKFNLLKMETEFNNEHNPTLRKIAEK
jgi:site-specific recombinase